VIPQILVVYSAENIDDVVSMLYIRKPFATQEVGDNWD